MRMEQQQKYGGGMWMKGKTIGRGSFGTVSLATLRPNKRRRSHLPPLMAVKSAEVSQSASLQKERESLSNLQGCPNVLSCFGDEITTDNNGQMIYNVLLEYASGGSLAQQIKNSSGGLPESDIRRYTRSILRGLNHIHGCGYVHCDIKPHNILLVSSTTTSSSTFAAKIADFGCAKRAKNMKKRKMERPCLRGTPLYMSPEAVADYIQEPPSDIWSLGCVVAEMVSGKPAWSCEPDMDVDDLLVRIVSPRELPETPSKMSKEGKDFLKRCFVRTSMYRWTAEMLLNHPFVAMDDTDSEEVEEVASATATGVISLTPSNSLTDCILQLETGTQPNLPSSSDNSVILSQEGSSASNQSGEVKEMKVQVVGNSAEEVTMGDQKRRKITSSTITEDDDTVECDCSSRKFEAASRYMVAIL